MTVAPRLPGDGLRPGRPVGGRRLALAWLAVALAGAGCGTPPLPATVDGVLRLDGRPLDNCLLTFLPEPRTPGPPSSGLTDGQGRYHLRGLNQQPGAAVGWHRVTIQDMSVSAGAQRRDHGRVDAETPEPLAPPPVRPSRLPKVFLDAAESPLRREIVPGPQVIDFDLRSATMPSAASSR